ncbi:MAG TPA: hypothetical protein ENH84_05380 [Phycisphaerae bacterium]|nr:hypothetical protein [Phycisphaerae bacterium]
MNQILTLEGDSNWVGSGPSTNGSDGVNLSSASAAATALIAVDAAIVTQNSYRAKLGYKMNRLESASDVLGIQSEHLIVAESRISNVEVALETTRMITSLVVAEASVAILAQANVMPQMALRLLLHMYL